MARTHIQCRQTRRVLPLVLSGVIGIVTLFSVAQISGQGTSKPKVNATVANEPDLGADLDNAMKIIEQGDFRTFFERYAPVEVLRRLRQQDLLDQAAGILSKQPQTSQQLLAILKALRKQTPTFDKSRGLATIQFDSAANGVETVPGELHLPMTDDVKLAGLGGDLKKVLAEATRLLAAGEVQTFVERMFPASEVARLQEPGAIQDLVTQIKGATDTARPPFSPPAFPGQPQGQETPSVLQTLQADFQLLQNLTPTTELKDKVQVATYRIESPNQPVRVIKFQKIGADWRLFDDAGRVTAELTRQSKLKPRSAVTAVQMERIGGNWRFIELPALRLSGK